MTLLPASRSTHMTSNVAQSPTTKIQPPQPAQQARHRNDRSFHHQRLVEPPVTSSPNHPAHQLHGSPKIRHSRPDEPHPRTRRTGHHQHLTPRHRRRKRRPQLTADIRLQHHNSDHGLHAFSGGAHSRSPPPAGGINPTYASTARRSSNERVTCRYPRPRAYASIRSNRASRSLSDRLRTVSPRTSSTSRIRQRRCCSAQSSSPRSKAATRGAK